MSDSILTNDQLKQITDVLAENKLSFDNKSNPDSDWKD